ncbi:hypothetical protein I79_005002 [Cricetulus griseus]|uniref:Uncharacterized protein n=1 Tax=Cricetulus griseus TaxID=10029 RepID=G3H409_CRIGR|nr:hypothetical protein I79_005002 [Cricetulus griseus]
MAGIQILELLLLRVSLWTWVCQACPSSFTVPSDGPGSLLSGEKNPLLAEALGHCFSRPWPGPAGRS